MVRVGFIVEGDTEKIFIESKMFTQWALRRNIEIVSPVLDAEGGGNLLPQNIVPLVRTLQARSPKYIVILTDSEGKPVREVIKRIGTTHTKLIFVAVKALEAWFLADEDAIKSWLSIGSFHEPSPESTPGMPWDRLKDIARAHTKEGPGPSKPKFAKKMVEKFGFSFDRAASHPSCPSAAHFRDGLAKLK